jgi:hypothetical protein
MKFTLGGAKVPNGTVLVFGIRYVPGGEDGPHSASRVFTYAMLKAGGLWYVTGTGEVPTAAGWPAVERWLERDNREVVYVRATHTDGMAEIWPAPPAEPAVEDPADPHPDGTGETLAPASGKC